MRFRLASLLVLLLVLAVGSTGSAAGAAGGPTGLHGFLLRADEHGATVFHRTPSFAWNPVPGALRYEFQLSTTSSFRANGILYDDPKLVTPVEAPRLTLPWITGSPHSLYARVRAFMPEPDGPTPWSAAFGFDVTPPPPPTPLPSYPGLLRWTPVDGADRYQVWLIDVASDGTGRIVLTHTNVLDERELYTFHQSLPWIGSVRWRVRAMREDPKAYRVNGIPVQRFGPWSPIYSSTNPPVSTGPISLVGTVSDVVSNGAGGAPAHQLMPAFVWAGNQTLAGAPAELFRVYAFTDSQCLNAVYTSPVVGTQAYAPRITGPLQLPTTDGGLTAARGGYLGYGPELSSITYDSQPLKGDINEQLASAQPTLTPPGDVPAVPGAMPPPDQSGITDQPESSPVETLPQPDTTTIGPPVDLWDVNWPEGGYYWTVVPVGIDGIGTGDVKVASPGAGATTTLLPVSSTVGFHVGDTVTIGAGTTAESATIASVGAGSISLQQPLANSHSAGETVTRLGGTITYQDLELPQDVCAAGRVMRFGIDSEPALTTAQTPFVTGLSSDGRLVSARHATTFYSQPLVAWTPALGASVYEVQWGTKGEPFKPTASRITYSTSTVLPVASGTWWYRVRGIDWNLPAGTQQMSWSDPQKIVVAKPTYRVTSKPTKPRRFKIVRRGK